MLKIRRSCDRLIFNMGILIQNFVPYLLLSAIIIRLPISATTSRSRSTAMIWKKYQSFNDSIHDEHNFDKKISIYHGFSFMCPWHKHHSSSGHCHWCYDIDLFWHNSNSWYFPCGFIWGIWDGMSISWRLAPTISPVTIKIFWVNSNDNRSQWKHISLSLNMFTYMSLSLSQNLTFHPTFDIHISPLI